MQRALVILIGLLAVGAIALGSADALPATPCCACIELSGAAQPPALPAFFCGYFPGAALGEAEARCEGFNQTTSDPGLYCVNGSAAECPGALADANIQCPAAAGAPTASSSLLAILVCALGAIGFLAARRRA
ncbi:MAG: hypothetical protein SF182_09220 [Deltaproteobacteria bacterium]|nr:hypothetical protein [Deltaproteobacteria bacterium]